MSPSSSFQALNRAVNRDIIVVRLLPEEQWKVLDAMAYDEAAQLEEEELLGAATMPSDLADLAAEAAEAEAAAGRNSGASGGGGSKGGGKGDAAVPDPKLKRQATAKVVAVVKRNWQPTAGSIDLATRRGNRVLFIPVNPTLPRVRIETRQMEALAGKNQPFLPHLFALN